MQIVKKTQHESTETMTKLRPTKNDLGDNVRKEMCALLNTGLATAIDLAAQAKQAHWNVRGPNFSALHPFFDSLYTIAVGMVDELAERITALGGFAEGRVQNIAAATKLPAYKAETDETDHLKALVTAFGTFANWAREGIDKADEKGDMVTADVLTGHAAELDKQLWMIEAHIAK